MEDFIGLLIMLIVVAVGGSAFGFFAFIQLTQLKKTVALLSENVSELQSLVKTQEPSHSMPVEVTPPEVSPSKISIISSSDLALKPHSHSEEKSQNTVTAKSPHSSSFSLFFKQILAGFEKNWMTWVGAIALAFGGIFLANYSLEAGLLSPSMRLSLGGVFGIGLIIAAAYLHFKRIVFEGYNNYIPAALASGGFITCFSLTLLAYSSFSILSPTAAFILLAIVAIGASIMAIALGPLLAVLGIIGAYSVPVWINTGTSDVFALLMYVGFVSLSATLVANKVQRYWLWYLMWIGHFGWYVAAFEFLNNQTVWIFGTYAIVSIIGLIAIPRLGISLTTLEHRPHHLKRLLKVLPDNLLLILLITPFMLSMLLSAYTMQWQIFSLIIITLLLFLVLKNSRWDLWQALSLLIAVLLIISYENTTAVLLDDALFIFKNEYALALLLGLALTGYGLYFGLRQPKRLAFHITGSFSVFVMIATLYALIPNTALSIAYPLWAVVLCMVAALLIKLAHTNTGLFQRFTYWTAANANITLAVTMLLSDSGLTIALAVQVLLISMLIKRYDVPMPHWPIKVLVAALLMRLTLCIWTSNYETLTLFGLHWSIVVYPLCVALFFLASKCINAPQLKMWLEGAALHTLALFITTETSYQLVGHYPQFDSLSVYEQILLTCNWLALGCVYLHRAKLAGSLAKLYQVAGLILTVGAGFFAVKTLVDDNPFFEPIYLGEYPLVNWLVFIWLVPALLLMWLSKLIKSIDTKVSPYIEVTAAGFVLLAINGFIRQYWQGAYINIANVTSNAELYSYSVIWLAIGAITVILAHLKRHLLAQKVGVAILAAVIVKVFLIDMANLTGLLKAVSFIGLGLSLVGLSWLFQKLRSRTATI